MIKFFQTLQAKYLQMFVRFDNTLQCLNIHLSSLQQPASTVIEHLYNVFSNNKLK